MAEVRVCGRKTHLAWAIFVDGDCLHVEKAKEKCISLFPSSFKWVVEALSYSTPSKMSSCILTDFTISQ